MIKLFTPEETVFAHNRDVLTECRSAVVTEQGNGDFSLELECPLSYAERIYEGCIVTAPTPRGEQPFRVFGTKKTLTAFQVYGRHVFYDTAANFLADCRPTDDNGQAACAAIMGGRLFSSPIVLSSDIPGIHTAYYVRKTELEALIGADNSFLANWGGHLIRNGFSAHFRNAALDHGFKVQLGRNLTGVEAVVDTTQVTTKVMPTFVLEDNQVYTLPETYIVSPLAAQYPFDIVRELRIDLTDAQRQQTAASLYPYIRQQATAAFASGLDKPKISYRINFVMLSKTEAYKDLGLLEQLDIWDLVTCEIPMLGIDVQLKMSAYKYDAIHEKFISMDLGDTRPTTASIAKRAERTIADQMARDDSPMMLKVNASQKKIADSITGVSGGNIIIRRDAAGKPYEILAMDTDNIATASEVVRINRLGIGLSVNGIAGPYGVAMDASHGLYADFIYGLSVTAAMIAAGAITAEKIAAGSITADKIAVGAVSAEKIAAGSITADRLSSTEVFALNGEFKGTIKADAGYIGGLTIANGTISGGSYTSTGFRVNGNGQAFMGSARSYNMQAYDMQAQRGSMSQMSATTFDLQSGSIRSNVTIGSSMFVSASGIRLNCGARMAVFENTGNAWLGIYAGNPDNAANVIWAVTQTGQVVTSDRRVKKDIRKFDGNAALDFIKKFNYYTFEMRNTGEPGLGVIANFFKQMDDPLADFILDKIDGKSSEPILAINYDRLAIINGAALQALMQRVAALEQEIERMKQKA